MLIHKTTILKDNKEKSGIYCLINKETKEFYVGSATNLSKRFSIILSL